MIPKSQIIEFVKSRCVTAARVGTDYGAQIFLFVKSCDLRFCAGRRYARITDFRLCQVYPFFQRCVMPSQAPSARGQNQSSLDEILALRIAEAVKGAARSDAAQRTLDGSGKARRANHQGVIDLTTNSFSAMQTPTEPEDFLGCEPVLKIRAVKFISLSSILVFKNCV